MLRFIILDAFIKNRAISQNGCRERGILFDFQYILAFENIEIAL